MNIDIIKKRIDQAEVVSFDLYDTLIHRIVERPIDVINMISDQAYDKYGISKDLFINERKSQEYYFVKANKKYSLKDVYNRMNIPGESKAYLYNAEVSTEIEISYVSEIGMKLYKYAKDKGKKLLLISDMYLGKEIIKKILEKNNYYFQDNQIFVSCDVGIEKNYFGKLFNYVVKKMRLRKDRIIHIGDDLKRDIIYSRINGIKSYKISFNRNLINQNRDYAFKNDYEKYGCNYFGPLTVNYIIWIHEECVKKGIHTLYFFSREGFLFKHIFDLLFDDIETKYLYVSRKALIIPLAYKIEDWGGLIESFPINEITTVGTLLKKVGLNNNKTVIDALSDFKINTKDKAFAIKNNKDLLNDILTELRIISLDQNTNIKKYIRSNVKDIDKIGVVDIGWTGGMLTAFCNLLTDFGYKAAVEGFYMGQDPLIVNYLKKGLISNSFLYRYNEEKLHNIFLSGRNVLESIYFADHGTTTGYDKEGNPILKDTELPEETIDKLLNMQSGIGIYAKLFGKILYKYNCISKKKLISFYKKIFKNPNKETLKAFGDICMYDEEVLYLAKQQHIIPLGDFFKALKKSMWQTAFLKRNLGMPFSYQLYRSLRFVAKKVL